MGKISLDYGSEIHLLRYLARHRHHLDREVLGAIGAGRALDWLDFDFNPSGTPLQDAELKGLEFLRGAKNLQAAWAAFWPQGRGIMNWDALAWIEGDQAREILLVEAKANLDEIRSSSGSTPEPRGRRGQIESAFARVKSDLGVPASADWMNRYYQAANRIAVLWFLNHHRIPARLLFLYFTADRGDGKRTWPRTRQDWCRALAAQDDHLGLPAEHRLSDRIHKLFLPVAG